MTPTPGFTHFGVSPSLPDGLVIDEMGVISGEPTVSSVLMDYTVSAENSNGKIMTTVVSIAITCPNFKYTPDTRVGIKGKSMGRMIPEYPFYNFTVVPSLPDGIEVRYDGMILGLPTVVSPTTSYTVSAIDSQGVIEWTNITITVIERYDLHYSPDHSVLLIQTAMSPMTPSPDFKEFSIQPELPTGLVLEENGVISGTPVTEMPETVYTVTAVSTITGESSSCKIYLTIVPSLQYDRNDVVITVKVGYPSLRPVTPNIEGFSVTPELPKGIHLNEESGEIGGLAAVATPCTDYTVSATLSGTQVSTIIRITVIEDSNPLKYDPFLVVIALQQKPKSMVPKPGFSQFSISPSLPGGCILYENGTITVVPNVVTPRTIYDVTAVDQSGETKHAAVAITIMKEVGGLKVTLYMNIGVGILIALSVLVFIGVAALFITHSKETPLLYQV